MGKRSSRSDIIFLSDAKKQYKLWKNSYKKRNKKYTALVKKINKSFKMKKKTDKFNTDSYHQSSGLEISITLILNLLL